MFKPKGTLAKSVDPDQMPQNAEIKLKISTKHDNNKN